MTKIIKQNQSFCYDPDILKTRSKRAPEDRENREDFLYCLGFGSYHSGGNQPNLLQEESESLSQLVIRLSSLGDLVLATAALESLPDGAQVDWVVRSEFAALLEGHPRIRRLWVFDRSAGFRGWVRLCRELWKENYSEVFDLHRSLRSRIARLFFAFWGRREGRDFTWKTVAKDRWRFYGLVWFKSFWPQKWHPQPWVKRFSRITRGDESRRPNLRHLASTTSVEKLTRGELAADTYLCVMPSAAWAGKRWGIKSYGALLRDLNEKVVVLGTDQDTPSRNLLVELKELGVPALSGVGAWSLEETATVLAGAKAYLGNDTGLAHLAEAVGTPAVTFFGPTVEELGFGPWRDQSLALGSQLWCRPCGKDGRYCFRPFERYLCMKKLTPKSVKTTLKKQKDANQEAR